MIGIAVIGYGYWGPNLVRNIQASDEAGVPVVCDQRPERLAAVLKLYPAVHVTDDFEKALSTKGVDAVAIATPVDTHYALTMAALRAGKHVLVEKPMASNSTQANEMRDEAMRRGLVLMVDHTFIYTSAVRKMKALIDSLGDLYYYDSVRVNLGLFQHDVNVMWDLAVHDLSIMQYLIPHQPTQVSATGIAAVPGHPVSVGYLTCYFDVPLIAHMHVNWLSPVKVRKSLIGGNQKMMMYDDLEPSEKVKIYDKGVKLVTDPDQVRDMLTGYRTGDMHAPEIGGQEALALEINHFAECIGEGRVPETDAGMGCRVVSILEAADRSLSEMGKPITLHLK